eukprot:m.444866 g.444866  ORF g.444866 m.444866 type:complete len:62 (+) comp20300_c5_seq4:859-1044(+)
MTGTAATHATCRRVCTCVCTPLALFDAGCLVWFGLVFLLCCFFSRLRLCVHGDVFVSVATL